MTDAPLHIDTFDATRRRGMALVFLAGVLWSTMGLGIRLIDEAGVWQIMFYRSISLSLFLGTVIALRSGRNPFAMARATGLPGLVGALGLIAAYSGAIFAIQTTSVANAMLLFAVAPFLAAVLGRIVLGERVRRATWFGIAVAMIGVAVMVSDQGGQGTFSGNIAALGSALGFAVFTVALRRGRSTEMLPAVFLSGLLAVLLTGAVCVFTGASLVLTAWDGGVALTMGVFQVGMGLMCYTIGSKTVPAVELTLLSLAEVVLGPVWVWLVLGETVGATTLLGGGILLGAIIGNALSGTRRRTPVHMP
ncbi:DMT family transporter [Shimia sediminis]|uniref:DMT family transporter n=1 Tax=Shimia sediminis TaxID=2497945 RepID=UPI000F8DD9BD|nr:DMT family transporter [Shimia sediminis]